MNRQCLKKFFKMQPPHSSKVQVDQHALFLIEKLHPVYWCAVLLGVAIVVLLALSIMPGTWLQQNGTNKTCIVWNRCVLEWNHDHPVVQMARTSQKPRYHQQARQLVEETVARLAKTDLKLSVDLRVPQTAERGKQPGAAQEQLQPARRFRPTTTPATGPTTCFPEMILIASDSESKLPTWQTGCLSFAIMVIGATCIAIALIIRGLLTTKPSLILYCFHSAGELFFAGAMMETLALLMYPRLLVETLKDYGSNHVSWYDIPGISFGWEYFYACISVSLLYVCAFLMMLDEMIYLWMCIRQQQKRLNICELRKSLTYRLCKLCSCPKTSSAQPVAQNSKLDEAAVRIELSQTA